MSRSTQYIGLTTLAHSIVSNNTGKKPFEMATGMFDEPVVGHIFHMPVPEGPNTAFYYKEEVQDMPWSSGPMIFTRLRAFLVKESGQVVDMGTVADWVRDPNLRDKCFEFDADRGTYYV